MLLQFLELGKLNFLLEAELFLRQEKTLVQLLNLELKLLLFKTLQLEGLLVKV